jgi:CBS domain-containing protein
MKVKDMMSDSVIQIGAEEPVEVAARTLAHYNIGALPVCDSKGKLCGIVTDRDIVTRCLAPGKSAQTTTVSHVMTQGVRTIDTEADAMEAVRLMGMNQIRRLPVTENGAVCGMLSLGDLSQGLNVEPALRKISKNIK